METKRQKKNGSARAAGKRMLRFSSVVALLLGGVFSVLCVLLAFRSNVTWESRVLAPALQVSERTKDILADTQGSVRIACFMDRRHPMFRHVSRLLRGFREASRRVAGAELEIEYVDPHWDLTRAGQLASLKVPENALVFEWQRRRIVVTLDDMISRQSAFRQQVDGAPPISGGHSVSDVRNRLNLDVFRGESVCAAAIARLALPYDRSAIYWLRGHGEVRHDDYDPLYGYSDIARELIRNGFDLKGLDLPGLQAIPADCQVLVIAGPRQAFVAEEIAMFEAYLQRGGRMLCLLTSGKETGLEKLLAKWGIGVTRCRAVSPRSLTGDEVICTAFADHVVTRDLANVSVVFGKAYCLEALQNVTVGPDRPQVTLLVKTGRDGWGAAEDGRAAQRVFDEATDLKGPVALAVSSEWGGNVAQDVAFKPTRLCVVGETEFVMNGTLASRANANRDFFLNAVSWLAGVDTGTAPSLGGDATLFTGLARREWVMLTLLATLAVPGGAFLIFCLICRRSRRAVR